MTVQEILKQSGLTDEQISALDSKIVSGFSTVLTTAAQDAEQARAAREAAELAQRTQRELYDSQIAPSLDKWGSEKATLEATVEFYRKQNEGARSAGFIPADAPGYKAPDADAGRGGDGRFVPGPTGSPQFLTPADGIKAVSNVTWVMSEYQRLHGNPLPDDFETLMNESVAQRLPFRDYVSKKYGFDAKRQEIATAAKQKELDSYAATKVEEVNRQWAERVGNNPNVRMPQQSQFDTLRRGVDAKQVKDPLTMNKQERHAYVQQQIHKDLTDNAAATVN